MKLEAVSIYSGDIRKCIKKQDELGFGSSGCSCIDNPDTKLYKRQALLLKLGKYYIDLDDVNNYLDCLLLISRKKALTTNYFKLNQLYVDRKTLKPYNINEKNKTKIKQLKKTS